MRPKNIIFLILFLAYLALVAWCCFGHFESIPNVRWEYFGIPTDKLVHCLMFAPFVVLSYLAFDFLGKGRGKALLVVLAVLTAGIIVALATEAGQSLTTYRSGDPRDFIADATGLGISTLITILIVLFTKK